MYKLATLVALAASVFSLVIATVPLYGQCGAPGWTGETVCTPPATCVYIDFYYSQCLVQTSTSTPSSTTTTTTISYIIDTTTTTPKSTTTTTTTKTTSTTTTSISYLRTTTTGNATTTTTPTKTTTTSSTVACYTNLPVFSAAPVRANTTNTAVTGLYLHRRSDGKAVLNKNIAGIPLYWTAPGTLALLEGSTTSDGKFCQVKDFLNVHADATSPAASYKPLQFDLGTPISNYWSSVHLSVTSASPWGAESWFLACPTSIADEYLVYLQTGTDVPSGQTCALTQLS